MSRAAPGSAPEIPGLVYRQPLGSGGYADVFLYEQQQPRMPVAVKVLKREGLTPTILRQFVDEANTMAQLADHPYIVQVFRSEKLPDGGAYLVMKYYPPPNLATRAKRERLTVEEVLRTGIQLASAVETAHRAGIIHRDIKPANVLISQYGSPGLTDFGIAGRGGQEEHDEDVGVSVPWSPPEVLYGQSNGDARSDVYSLAATLWHLLVGRSPFEQPGGDNSAYSLMPRIRATPVPQTGRADVPLSLERLLGHAMAKKPDARPQSAIDLARALQAIEQEQRFARTPIVVLDESGHTTVADSRSQVAPEHTDPDRTSVRAPTVSSAQAYLPAPASRPATTEGGTDDGPAPTTISGGALLAGVGVLMVLLVGALVWAVGFRGDEPTDEATDAPSASVTAGAGGPVVDIPEQPAMDGRAVAGGVAFSWNYAGVRKGDFYRMRIAASEAEVAQAEVTTVRKMPHTAAAKPGAQVCAQVAVARAAGATSPYSPIKCVTGG
ncbi:serine/threonine-protein kinase [Knoellia sp. S7-12]|uniref:serine/threonine-protein kinase n=1 Tax=Knoellia sp. S7-12 TaxID=3126698 RepID=UPI0033680AE5